MELIGSSRNAKGAPFLFVEIVKAFLLTYKMSMFQTHCCSGYTHRYNLNDRVLLY